MNENHYSNYYKVYTIKTNNMQERAVFVYSTRKYSSSASDHGLSELNTLIPNSTNQN